MDEAQFQDAIDDLAQRERGGCIDLSDLSQVVQELELSDDDGQALHDALEQRGFELHDDCGREQAEQTAYVNGEMADRTTPVGRS